MKLFSLPFGKMSLSFSKPRMCQLLKELTLLGRGLLEKLNLLTNDKKNILHLNICTVCPAHSQVIGLTVFFISNCFPSS